MTYRSRASGNFPLEPGTANVSIDTETSGFTFAVLGVLPLTRDWELFARAGALFADNELSIEVTSQGQQFIPPLGNRFAASDSAEHDRGLRRPRHQLGASSRSTTCGWSISAYSMPVMSLWVARATWMQRLLGLIVTF